jgi:tetratricopeptide (TPR) repeat protein
MMKKAITPLILLATLAAARAGVGNRQAAEPSPAVVTITQLAADGAPLLNGRGFLISADGVLVTGYHLITQATKLRIRLSNGDVYDQATIRALDPAGDLAILKIPAFRTPAVAMARRELPAAGANAQIVLPARTAAATSTRSGKVLGHYKLAPGLEAFAVSFALEAATRGCPVLDERGECLGVATPTFQTGGSAAQGGAGESAAAASGVVISANRILDLLEDKLGKPINRPLDLMDWSAWKSAPDQPTAEQLAQAGLRRHWPRPELWTEKNQTRRLELALTFDPADREIKTLLARVLIQQRLFERARRHLDELLAAEPEGAQLVELKGDLEYHQGNFDQARKLYRQIVTAGQHPPHNYDRKYDGAKLHGVSHSHFGTYCEGPVILGAREFVYLPGWPLDQFAVVYDKLKLVTLRPSARAGQAGYEIELKFAGEIFNLDQTQKKEDLKLLFTERAAKDNLIAYLRQRGVEIAEAKKR